MYNETLKVWCSSQLMALNGKNIDYFSFAVYFWTKIICCCGQHKQNLHKKLCGYWKHCSWSDIAVCMNRWWEMCCCQNIKHMPCWNHSHYSWFIEDTGFQGRYIVNITWTLHILYCCWWWQKCLTSFSVASLGTYNRSTCNEKSRLYKNKGAWLLLFIFFHI